MKQAIEKIESLILDPANSETPHCIEEYNAGLRNAIGVLNGSVDV